MKYIVLAFEGFIYPLAHQLLQEGNEVIVTQVQDIQRLATSGEVLEEDAEEKRLRLLNYDGILKKIDADVFVSQAKYIAHPEEYFVICESNTLFYYAQKLAAYGFKGIFPTEEDRQFELDRNKAKQFVKRYYPHLNVAPVKQFHSIAKAKAFIKKSKDMWVVKSQTDDIVTFVPPTRDLLLARKQIDEQLEINKAGYEQYGFILEKKIDDIIELTPEKIYYDGKPLGMSVMFENKYIGSGNLSYQVTCGGDLSFPVSMKSTVHDLCFPPIVDEMAKEHKGLFIWDASLLIDQATGKIYFGEFCPNRFGINAFLSTLEQFPQRSTFFEMIVKQLSPYTIGSLGVSVTLFNLLQENSGRYVGDIAIDYPNKYAKHIWPFYIHKNNTTYHTLGYDSPLAPITASGTTISDAVNTLYTYVQSVTMNNVYYRPKFDWLSKEYATALLNRFIYCQQHHLFDVPFAIE